MVARCSRTVAAAVVLAVLGSVLPLTGCGPTSQSAPATVRGSVSFQGRPLAGGLVVFSPDRDKGNVGKPASATIGPDGTFVLTADGTALVSPGWYRVALADPPGVFTEELGFPRFPAALRRPDRSGLAREVLPGRENHFVFDVEVTAPTQ